MTIKELRQINKLSQREFGEKIGVSQASIYRWEKEDMKISKETEKRIDIIFGLQRKNKRATSFDLGVEL